MKAKGFILGVATFIALNATAHAQDAYQTEYQRAIQGAVANIQSNGAVVASPSQTQPNYYFDWIRDTSLTMKAVVTLAYDPSTRSPLQADLLARIDRWIDWELGLQSVPKLTDLGEPRFYLSGQANNEPWGRPQNDGPALRALTAMMVANKWIDEGRLTEVANKLYKSEIPATTLIKRDLEYVAHHWMEPSFDLWEEEKGMHFYTLTAQKVALLKGADLANRLGDGGAANFYAGQSKAIDAYLTQFYDAASGTLKYAIDSNKLPQKTTNLDVSILLAAIQTFDGQFYVNIDQLSQTVNALIAQFNHAYSINQVTRGQTGNALGVGLGRYPGDVYSGFDFSGGNPWFLSTLALAEFYCDVNKAANHDKAMAQFDRVIHHMNAAGDLSEQFSRANGFEQGAHDLTWSYTSYITAYRACF
jgi:glucoamylase